jgi:23S rRNA pseudouridine1911/1915/1917 synthase
LLVLNKAAGVVVHPAPGHATGTLVHALLHHITDLSGIGGELRPGIVHRLDRDTSGLMLVAKHDVAHRQLSDALKRREVRRSYNVAVWGHLVSDAVEVDAPIGRARNDRKRMAVVPGGRPARTRFRRTARWVAADLLEAELDTGRTHQIRVHLAHIGHPVVGDRTYGGGAVRGLSGPGHRWGVELARRVPRQFLHAARLQFGHPRTGEQLVFSAPLPADLEAAAEWAGTTSHNR